MLGYITDNKEISSDDSHREDSNEELSNGKVEKKTIMKKMKYRMCFFKTLQVILILKIYI